MPKVKSNSAPVRKGRGETIASRKYSALKRTQSSSTGVIDLMGSRFFARPTQEKIGIIRAGISKNQLVKLKEQFGLDYVVLSQILSVAKTTLHNKKGTQKFDSPTSEKILSLADLYSYGYDVFEEKESFNRWMNKPSMALGDKKPIDYVDTLYGIEEIKKEIGRIEWGVY